MSIQEKSYLGCRISFNQEFSSPLKRVDGVGINASIVFRHRCFRKSFNIQVGNLSCHIEASRGRNNVTTLHAGKSSGVCKTINVNRSNNLEVSLIETRSFRSADYCQLEMDPPVFFYNSAEIEHLYQKFRSQVRGLRSEYENLRDSISKLDENLKWLNKLQSNLEVISNELELDDSFFTLASEDITSLYQKLNSLKVELNLVTDLTIKHQLKELIETLDSGILHLLMISVQKIDLQHFTDLDLNQIEQELEKLVNEKGLSLTEPINKVAKYLANLGARTTILKQARNIIKQASDTKSNDEIVRGRLEKRKATIENTIQSINQKMSLLGKASFKL